MENVILQGVVGSTAYGLATPDSDIDRLGCFAAPSEQFWRLSQPAQSHVTNDPDVTMHEVGKMIALLIKCNPTVSELLYLDTYEACTDDGAELIAMRQSFLSSKYVRDAYLGYATQQFKKLSERGGTFSSDLAKRTEKHARHLLRLLHQGYELYATGTLTVRLSDPERYHIFGRQVARDPTIAVTELRISETLFERTASPLPAYVDAGPAEQWLVNLRRKFL